MANEKIHEYLEQVQMSELINNDVYIDTDVFDFNVGDWVSKKLWYRDIISPYAKAHASVLSQQNISIPTANIARPIPWWSQAVMNNIGIQYDGFGTPSYLVPFKSGVYKFEVTLQISRNSGGSAQQLSAWFKYNGQDIPNSNIHINTVANSNFMMVQFSVMISMNAYDNVQIMWSVTDTGIYLQAENPNTSVPHPATPACRLLITNV